MRFSDHQNLMITVSFSFNSQFRSVSSIFYLQQPLVSTNDVFETSTYHTIIVECVCAAGDQLLNRISVQSPQQSNKVWIFEQNIVVVSQNTA